MKHTIICALVLLFALGCRPLKKHMPPGFGEGVMIDYPPIPGGRPQGPSVTPGETRGEKRQPSGSGFVPDAAAVVLPSILPVTMSCIPTADATYYFYVGTNSGDYQLVFPSVISIVNTTVNVPEDTAFLYSKVAVHCPDGTVKVSEESRWPDWKENAAIISSTIPWPEPVFLCMSPDRKYWACHMTNLPFTNALTGDAGYFRVIPLGGFPTNSAGEMVTDGMAKLELTAVKARIWNEEKGHFGE